MDRESILGNSKVFLQKSRHQSSRRRIGNRATASRHCPLR
ncbi:hypothetical protein BRADI_1g65983v3 [Brachypodium distachyon]|uniref:Uncharacterized protein n=1 Tax=Brachypodium distachyon TaxID=15368 RepID=A0A2K2DTL5_BRADI|nr:hypothetical protein BRADI_1g65983v3 [Brachypodium distachyon]